MKTEFKFVGLSRLNNEHYMAGTCQLKNEQDFFQCAISGDSETKESLWKYCEGNWKEDKIAVVEHAGLTSGGIPINPVILSIGTLKNT